MREVVRRFGGEARSGEAGRRGCFVTNTAAELGPHDDAAARRVERSWEHLETLLHSALVRARAQGELPEDRDPLALARMLLVLMQGIRVVGKASSDPARVRDAVEQALALLD
ncbi:TetR/AcrR family transcriptional regulator OS=Streptomyces alboniger OX=132473 GN=CP975_11160 PE=4 SV=1 [Streptomyces alboniger]